MPIHHACINRNNIKQTNVLCKHQNICSVALKEEVFNSVSPNNGTLHWNRPFCNQDFFLIYQMPLDGKTSSTSSIVEKATACECENLESAPESTAIDSDADTPHKSFPHTDSYCDSLICWTVPFDSYLRFVLNKGAN